jgi:transcription termination factor Rho
MPSNRFFDKKKEDLILLATLGRVLTLEQARDMTREDLAEFLFKKDQESEAQKSPEKNNESREKKPLTRQKKSAESVSAKDEDTKESLIPSKEIPSEKLSKKELNKQRFMEEMASKEKGTPKETDMVPKETGSAVKLAERKAGKAVKAALTDESSAESSVQSPAAVLSDKPGALPVKKAAAKPPKIHPQPVLVLDPEPDSVYAEEPKTEESKAEEPKNDKKRRASKGDRSQDILTESAKSASTDTTINGEMNQGTAQVKGSAIPDSEGPAEFNTQNSTIQIQKHHRHITRIIEPDDIKDDFASDGDGEKRHHEKAVQPEVLEMVEGALEIMPDGYGFLRKSNYLQSPHDIYIPPQYIRRFGLRPGDWITGPGKQQRETDRYQAILYIKEVNGISPEKLAGRPQFDQLTPIYPDERFILETVKNELSTRIIDLVAPIGKGQRGMIVSPPKAGKTILLQKIANAISINNPETKLIVLLIDERPEEVTDMQRSINGEVVYSTFDKTPENHVKIVELVLERAMRLVELGRDVVILLDSITRLARAYNLTINPTGRTLSGGLDPGALYGPKRFFGSARNIENGGSLTIIATSLIDTGSRMDEVIFEEFKGTGNMEVYLDRKLSEKRIFPAIDLNRSGTRREELLLSKRELDAVWTIRKAFGQLDTAAVTEMIINLLLKTNTNSHFVSSVNVSLNDKAMFDAMRGTKPGSENSGGQSGGSSNQGGKSYNGGGSYSSGGY